MTREENNRLVSELRRKWLREGDGITRRESMVLQIMRSDLCDAAAAHQRESRLHDAAWSKSLVRQDASHDPCDHDERVYDAEYALLSSEYLRHPANT